MKVTNIVLSRRWRNMQTGQTASIYGAVPYTRESERADWMIETVGWTWELDNGRVGLGRPPAETYEAALAVLKQINGEGRS